MDTTSEAFSVEIINNVEEEESEPGASTQQSLVTSRITLPQCSPASKKWRFLIGCAGAGCYEVFSLFVSSPDVIHNLFRSNKLFSIVSNSLWASAHIGLVGYTFCSNLMRHFSFPYRALYSTTGGVVFNFGSVLLWAILKKLTPSDFLRSGLALLSGLVLLYVGSSFLEFREGVSNSSYIIDEDDEPSSSNMP